MFSFVELTILFFDRIVGCSVQVWMNVVGRNFSNQSVVAGGKDRVLPCLIPHRLFCILVVSSLVSVFVTGSSGASYAASSSQSSGQGGNGGVVGAATQTNLGSVPDSDGNGGRGGDGEGSTQNGGAGGQSPFTSGGTSQLNGSDGGSSGGAGGGGGGGGGAQLDTLNGVTSFTAGNGGDGGDGATAAGSGGAGGSVYTADQQATVNTTLTGGNGGRGGSGITSADNGHGGRGGDALVVNSSQTFQPTITIGSASVLLGGNGGDGGNDNNGLVISGSGGDGGNGVSLGQNTALIIEAGAQVVGGHGGSAGTVGAYSGVAGRGGFGVYMSGNDQLTTAGTITGGDLSSASPVPAVQLDGGNNTLTLEQGYVFNGNVISSGYNDTLVLGGSTDGVFSGTINLSSSSTCTQDFCGFTNYEKTGTSVWTLNTQTTQAINWVIAQGSLRATSLTLGSGAIEDNSNLELDQAVNATVANSITGSGSLNKSGLGTLTLTGVNTYSGGTVITEGTLQGAANNFGTGSITDYGTLAVVQPTAATLANNISGSGALNKSGVGTLTLSGVNTYTGGTVISDGTLQGSANSFGSGGIVNNGTLSVLSSTSAIMNNAISGSGDLQISGNGILTLGGMNSYLGKTILLSGSLGLAQGQALGSSQLSMAAGTTLAMVKNGLTVSNAISLNTGTTVDVQSGVDTLSGSLSDGAQTGELVKTGEGMLILSGINTYTGTTEIAAGTLRVTGDLETSSSITADDGTTLSGTGTLGNTIMKDGSTLYPSGGTGDATLTVNGNLTLQSGSTYMVNSVLLGTSDKVDVTGSAMLGSGAQLAVNSGAWETGVSYHLLHADQKITGSFGNVSTSLVFLTPIVSYSGNDIFLNLVRNQASFSIIGGTRNEQAVESGLGTLQSGQLSNAILDSDAKTLRRAFNLLSGEIYASARTSLVQDAFYVRDAAINRLLSADCQSGGGVGQKTASLGGAAVGAACLHTGAVWMQSYGSFGHTGSDGNASSLSENTGGFVLGMDAPLAGWHVGMLSGYGHSVFSSSAVGSSGESNNVNIGAYAGTHWGPAGLRLGAAYTFNMLSASRHVVFGSYSAALRAHYTGGTAQAFGELGYGMSLGSLNVEPFANVAFVNTHSARYNEYGSDAALQVDATGSGTTFSTFGARLGTHFRLCGLSLNPLATLAYRHAFGGITPTVSEQFAGGQAFEVAGAPLASDSALMNVGLYASVSERINIGLSYVGQYASMTTMNGVTGNMRLYF